MGLLLCLLNVAPHTLTRRRGRNFCVSTALPNNKEPFGASETTYQIFTARSFNSSYNTLLIFLFFLCSSACSVLNTVSPLSRNYLNIYYSLNFKP
jgi:hypothetical protein